VCRSEFDHRKNFKISAKAQLALLAHSLPFKVRLFHELLPSQLPGYFISIALLKRVTKMNKRLLLGISTQAWKCMTIRVLKPLTPISYISIEASSLDESSKEKLTLLLRNHQQSASHSLASR